VKQASNDRYGRTLAHLYGPRAEHEAQLLSGAWGFALGGNGQ